MNTARLQIQYIDGSPSKVMSLPELLDCQIWSAYNRERLERLCRGQIRRFMTSIRGKDAEIERVT